jgi:phosphocarrier protein HPr
MIECSAIVQNAQGIHCRPSAVIIKEVHEYPGHIVVSAHGQTCDLRSVIGLLALGLQKDSEVRIQVSGPNEEALCKRLAELFATQFDFPPRMPDEDPMNSIHPMSAG